MATEQTTIAQYALDSNNRRFIIPFEYLSRPFVKVTLMGTDRRPMTLGSDYRYISINEIETTRAWGDADGYQSIELRRVTSATDRLVEFSDGSVLRSRDMNVSAIQTIHIAEEARNLASDTLASDDNGNLDARGRRLVNLGDAVNPKDAMTLDQVTGWSQSALNQANRSQTEADKSAARAAAALASQNAAAASQSAAKTSETNAKTSETNAKTSETNAKTSETKAKTSETNAKTSETNAKTSETNAKASELAAEGFAAEAESFTPVGYLRKIELAQGVGTSTETAMAQKATTDALALKANTSSLGTAAAANLTTSTTDGTPSRVLKVGDGGWMGQGVSLSTSLGYPSSVGDATNQSKVFRSTVSDNGISSYAAGIHFAAGTTWGRLRVSHVSPIAWIQGGFTDEGSGWTAELYHTGNTPTSHIQVASLVSSGNITAYSDIKLKENIEVIPDALAKLNTLHGYTYKRKDSEGSSRHTGVIAQEVREVLPEAVMEDEEGTLSVAYGNMVGLLIEAIKELKVEVDRLKVNHKEDI